MLACSSSCLELETQEAGTALAAAPVQVWPRPPLVLNPSLKLPLLLAGGERNLSPLQILAASYNAPLQGDVGMTCQAGPRIENDARSTQNSLGEEEKAVAEGGEGVRRLIEPPKPLAFL